MSLELKFPFYAKASLIVIGLSVFVAILYIAQSIILPILYALIIAIVLSPIVNFLVRKKMNRIVAITFILAILIILIVLIAFLLSNQLMNFTNSFPLFIQKFYLFLDQLVVWMSSNFNISPDKINQWITNKNEQIINKSSVLLGQTLIGTGNIIIILILLPVYVFLLLFYQQFLLNFIHQLFHSSKQNDVNLVLTSTKRIIQSYLVGLFLETLIIAILNSTFLLLLGIDYAILLGVIGAILNLVPYIGGIVAVALPMLIAIITKSPIYPLLVLASYIFIQFIDNNIIIPKVVASKVQINALVSIVVVIIGGALWGVSGMFLSIPLTAILKVIFDHIESLKPWGYLLGDSMPSIFKIKYPFKK